MYAVIDYKGHQYIVQEWDVIVVDRVSEEEKANNKIETVLASFESDASKVSLGAPYLKNASVEVNFVEDVKGDKIRVTKFKRKNRYQRTIWFRPYQTVLQIQKITI